MNSKKILWIALILSLLLHVIVIIFFPHLSELKFIALKPEQEKIDDSPIVFEFIETPDVPEVENVEKQNLVSDKSLIASDNIENNLPTEKNPFSQGDTEIKQFPMNESAEINEEKQINEPLNEEIEESDENHGEELTQQDMESKPQILPQPESLYIPPQSEYENIISQVENSGGVSFNTYKWDFAPYMLYLKKKIQGNLNPPPGFTHLGLIHGKVLVRFTIMPDGELKNLNVLHSEAHNSLVQASTGAISISAPFLPLPDDFPEDYLIVTSLFSYIIQKN